MRQLFGLSLILASTLSAACYAPTYVDCAFRCGSSMPACPDEYECRSDGYCHVHDSAITCSFATDMSAAQDLASGN